MTERAPQKQVLTAIQDAVLHTTFARGIGLDRLGRMSTMREFDEVVGREHRQPITIVEIGGGFPLHSVAMNEYWLQMSRSTALEVVKDFGKLLRTDQLLGDGNGKVSEYFPDQATRDKVIANFADPNKATHKMLVAALTEVLAQPPEFPETNTKRKTHLAADLYRRFSFAQAFEHVIEEDISADEHGLGKETVITPKMYGGKGFRDMIHEMVDSDGDLTDHVIRVLAVHFGTVLQSPHTIKPFQVISLDARSADELADVADALYPEWFKETKRYKRAMEFNGFVQQENPWDLDSLDEEQVTHMVVKNPIHNLGMGFSQFSQEAPLVIARNGFAAIVPAFVQHEGEQIKIDLGGTNRYGLTQMMSEWIDNHGFETGIKGYAVEDVKIAGTNSYERTLFEEGPVAKPYDKRNPQRLYVVTFQKPSRSLAERVEGLQSE